MRALPNIGMRWQLEAGGCRRAACRDYDIYGVMHSDESILIGLKIGVPFQFDTADHQLSTVGDQCMAGRLYVAGWVSDRYICLSAAPTT